MDTELMLDVGQANEIKMAARRAGATNADLKKLSTGEMFAKILPVIRGLAQVVPMMKVIVATFQSLLDACHQAWVSSDINEKNFPLIDDGTTGPVEEHCLGHDVSSGREAKKELKKLGYKLVGMKRAMEYIAVHPDNQLDHPIVVLGAQWQIQIPCGFVYVPYFYRDDGQRYLILYCLDLDFASHCRFLVARE